MHTYSYQNGEHRFSNEGAYLGFFDSSGAQTTIGSPFISWEKWDQAKHEFLISLGFENKN